MKKMYVKSGAMIVFFFVILQHGTAQCCQYDTEQQFEPLTSAATFGVGLGDFNGDGFRDVVSISAYYGIDVYFNDGTGTFTLSAQYATGTNPDFYGVNVADVDGDGDLDIVAMPFYSSTNLTILKNNGSGIFTVTSVSSNIYTYNGAVGDIDGDGDVDIVLPNASGTTGKTFKNNGTGTFVLYQSITNLRGRDAEIADLNGDGHNDIFSTDDYGNAVFINDGLGNFTQLGSNFGDNSEVVALGDLDGDGDIDAFVGLGISGASKSEIWLNNGSGVFALHSDFTTGSYTKAVKLYDRDNDGDLDVFLSFYSTAPQVWTNNGNLTFTLCYQASVGSSSHGMDIGDMNNDGKIDMYSGYFSNDDGDWVFLDTTTVAASIFYENTPFCPTFTAPQPVTLVGLTGGVFSSTPAGLSIDPSTGAVTPSASLPGTYVVTYTVGGCPYTTTVVIKELDLTTSLAGSVITANQGGGVYQWIDCNTLIDIPGETAQSFTALTAGSYAAIVTYDGCMDTTDCVTVSFVGIEGAEMLESVSVTPNPADDYIFVEQMNARSGIALMMYDMTGRLIVDKELDDVITMIDVSYLKSGVYLIALTYEGFSIKRKVIIQ